MNVPVSGKVVGEKESANLQAVIAEANYTAGRWVHQFERMLREYIGTRFAITCNSGSSANLLALTALTAKELGDRRILPGDEVITTALNFPTTVNPIVQIGALPVFVDVKPDMTADMMEILKARSVKTKAVILAHTLGRPHDIANIAKYCKREGIWLIEDCCDALGTETKGAKVGTFGDLATLSFYPAHHITTGEGGCVLTDDPVLAKISTSFRDWGRDCWCAPGVDNTCGRRFASGRDHKYTYSRLGYNLKPTDFMGAIGCAQMDQVDMFNARRVANYSRLYDALLPLEKVAILPLVDGMVPFGFPIIANDSRQLVAHLEANNIATRPVFAGNITKQPAYEDVNYRVSGHLHMTGLIHEHGFWIGCWHGLTDEQIDYTIEVIRGFYS